jgi:hypothetical protein
VDVSLGDVFSQHLRDVPPEEIKAAAIAAFGG